MPKLIELCRLIFDEPMLRNIRKYTVEEVSRQTGDQTWDVALFEQVMFIRLVAARDVIVEHNFPVVSLWGKQRGCAMLSQTAPRDKFFEIMIYLRFEDRKAKESFA